MTADAAAPPDPFYARLRAAQADPAAAAAMQDSELLSRMAAHLVPHPGYIPPEVRVADERLPGPHGEVPVRVYRPADEAGGARPLLLWVHGGGWLEGDLDMPEADATSREVCARAGAVVVSVDYRLASEGVHYPVPLDDVVAAWLGATELAPQWDAAPDLGVLGGASAGANLAAGAALRMRDQGDPLPASLALIYPALHAELPRLTDEQRAATGVSPQTEELFRRGLLLMLENYLGASAEQAPGYVVPASADLRGLPPTLVMTCAYDVMRSSGEAFAEALLRFGVPCTGILVPDVGHAHLNSPWLPQAQASYGDLADWVSRAHLTPPRREHA